MSPVNLSTQHNTAYQSMDTGYSYRCYRS